MIKDNEYFGKHTWLGDSMEVPICCYNFQMFPVPQNTILREYNETDRKKSSTNKNVQGIFRKNQKYILGQITENLEEFE